MKKRPIFVAQTVAPNAFSMNAIGRFYLHSPGFLWSPVDDHAIVLRILMFLQSFEFGSAWKFNGTASSADMLTFRNWCAGNGSGPCVSTSHPERPFFFCLGPLVPPPRTPTVHPPHTPLQPQQMQIYSWNMKSQRWDVRIGPDLDSLSFHRVPFGDNSDAIHIASYIFKRHLIVFERLMVFECLQMPPSGIRKS